MISTLVVLSLLTAPLASPEVTLDEALALALEHNTELKVTRAEVEVAQASIPLAHDWNMPSLRAQVSDVTDLPTGLFTWNAGLSWRPPNPWEWKNGTDAAEAKVVQSRFELAASSWKVLMNVRLAWLDVSGAAAHEHLAKDAVESRGRLLWVLRRRLEQGGGTQVEVNLAQLGETDARQELLRWQGAGLKAAQSVAWLVGQSVTPIPSPLSDVPPVLPDVAVLEKRLERQPRLEALRAKVQVTQAEQRNNSARDCRPTRNIAQARWPSDHVPVAADVGERAHIVVTQLRTELRREEAVRVVHLQDTETCADKVHQEDQYQHTFELPGRPNGL